MSANGKKKNNKVPVIVLVSTIAVLLSVLVYLLAKGTAAPSVASPTVQTVTSAPESSTVQITTPVAVSQSEEHTHTWASATCTRPATCTICGATQGSALGHTWKAATTTAPRTCTVCGQTEGTPMTPTPAPVPTKNPDTATAVDLFTEDYNYTEEYTVQVAHSQSFSSCEKAVRRLREAGYNAYLYEQLDKTGYCIMIGVFSSLDEAQKFADFLHTQPEVKGVRLDRAYVCHKARLSSDTVSKYTSVWW